MENSIKTPHKAKKAACDPAIPLLGIYVKECKSGYNKHTCTPMVITALFTIPKLWKQPECPTTDEWIKKMWYQDTANSQGNTQQKEQFWRYHNT
jgi:hypothetical protein